MRAGCAVGGLGDGFALGKVGGRGGAFLTRSSWVLPVHTRMDGAGVVAVAAVGVVIGVFLEEEGVSFLDVLDLRVQVSHHLTPVPLGAGVIGREEGRISELTTFRGWMAKHAPLLPPGLPVRRELRGEEREKTWSSVCRGTRDTGGLNAKIWFALW